MERHSGAFTVLFRQGRRVVRLHVRGAARQDEEKLGERARGMAMHYEATAKSGANARALLPSTSGSPRPPLLLLARASLL